MALFNTPHPSGKLAKWWLTLQKLQDVDIVIWYHPGKDNTGADALSHLPVDQDDDVDPSSNSLLTEQVIEDLGDSELLVAAIVVEDNAKNRPGREAVGKLWKWKLPTEENNGNVSINREILS